MWNIGNWRGLPENSSQSNSLILDSSQTAWISILPLWVLRTWACHIPLTSHLWGLNDLLWRMNELTQLKHVELCSVISNSLWPHELYPTRLLCPWYFPGKNTVVGCHFLLQGIFPTQGSNSSLWHHRQILYHLNHQGRPSWIRVGPKSRRARRDKKLSSAINAKK